MPKEIWTNVDGLEGKWSYASLKVRERHKKTKWGIVSYGYIEVSFNLPKDFIGEEIKVAIQDLKEELMKKRHYKLGNMDNIL